MRIINSLLVLLAVVLLAACSSDSPVENTSPTTHDAAVGSEILLSSVVVADPVAQGLTRSTTDNSFTGTAFSTSSRIDVHIVEDSDSPTTTYGTNGWVAATANGGTTTFDSPQYWPSSGKGIRTYAWHPLLDSSALGDAGWTSLASPSASVYTVPADQSGLTLSAYDLLFSAPQTVSSTSAGFSRESPVSLVFSHKLAKLVVQLEAGSGISASLQGATIELTEVMRNATVNLVTGAVSAADGATGTLTLMSNGASTTAYALVPAQTLTGVLTVVLPGDDEAVLSTSSGINFTVQAGRTNTFTVTVDLTGLTLSTQISPWDVQASSDLGVGVIDAGQMLHLSDITGSDYAYTVGMAVTSDGYLYESGGAAAAAGKTVIGMVAYVGDSEVDTAARGSRILVTAIEDATVNGESTFLWSNKSTEDILYQSSTDMNGLEFTESHYNLTDDDSSICYPAAHAAISFNNVVSRPSGASIWFLPSAGQMVAMGAGYIDESNYRGVGPQVTGAYRKMELTGEYWSASVSSRRAFSALYFYSNCTGYGHAPFEYNFWDYASKEVYKWKVRPVFAYPLAAPATLRELKSALLFGASASALSDTYLGWYVDGQGNIAAEPMSGAIGRIVALGDGDVDTSRPGSRILVMALHNANGNANTEWAITSTSYFSDASKYYPGSDFSTVPFNGLAVTTDMAKSSSASTDFTAAWYAYNYGNDNGLSKPSGASDWFLPSYGQLNLIMDREAGIGRGVGSENISSYAEWLGAIWSCTERYTNGTSSSGAAWAVYTFNSGDTIVKNNIYSSGKFNGNGGRVRAVFVY